VTPDIPCVGAVVLDATGRILVVQRANEPAAGQWSLPGGRVEPGESARDAVVREVREETGIQITVIREVGTVVRDAPGGGRYVIRDFLGEPAREQAPIAADDAADARFVTEAELHALPTTAGLIEALTEWQVFGGVLGSPHGAGTGDREPKRRGR
jgi:8-oxo-dGTP diphosphatase